MQAYVVFSDHTDLWYLQFLKRGFRHCFLIFHDGRHWISIDPLSNHVEWSVLYHLPLEFDVAAWVRVHGCTMIEAFVDTSHQKPAPLMLFTCVEFVKRFLGVHARFIQTPWQLYRFLKGSDDPQSKGLISIKEEIYGKSCFKARSA